MASSTSRPLRLRMRADLVEVQQTYQGRDYWVLKDPISLKYYRFEEEEYQLLKLIDGVSSPDQIKREFDYRFAPQKISQQELYQFIGMLYRSSLLISDAVDQGLELKKRAEKTASAVRRQSITNILAIRFKGFDPDAMLTAINRYTYWLFSWPVFVMALLLGISAAGLIFAQFETFEAKLPSFYDFFAAKNWIWLAIVMGMTKVLHEFGHGLACKKFGGQCHEMGFMLLVMTPCLYMNVSDSWLLKSKWKRAFIAAAGMYVELVLASLAVFVWWFSLPGLVNQLALNIIFVCSVSTLLFNANPLLRYDGYYILADLLEIPNLRSKATTVLQRFCGRLFLGLQSASDPFLPTRHVWLFGLYSIAAAGYRWLITFSIFWFVYRVLEPYGLKIFGQMLALMALYGLLVMPFVQAYRFFSVPGRMAAVKQIRFAMTLCLITTVVGLILLLPVPHHIYCSFVLQPKDAANVYVKVPGTLVQIYVLPNSMVQAGDTLAVLANDDLDRQIVNLQTKVHQAASKHKVITKAASFDSSRGEGVRLAESEAAFETARRNLSQRQLDQEDLIIAAPRSGFLLAPPRRNTQNDDPSQRQTWTGIPLEPKNMGAWLEKETLIGQIVPDLSKFNAVLAIDQTSIELVHQSQRVELQLQQSPLKLIESTIPRITPVKMQQCPPALSSKHGGDLETQTNSNGDEVPISTTYLATVPVVIPEDIVISGGTGTAKIYAGTQTIGQRIWRMLSHTFQFEL